MLLQSQPAVLSFHQGDFVTRSGSNRSVSVLRLYFSNATDRMAGNDKLPHSTIRSRVARGCDVTTCHHLIVAFKSRSQRSLSTTCPRHQTLSRIYSQ